VSFNIVGDNVHGYYDAIILSFFCMAASRSSEEILSLTEPYEQALAISIFIICCSSCNLYLNLGKLSLFHEADWVSKQKLWKWGRNCSRMMIRVHHTESLMRLLPNTIFRLIPRHIPLSITQTIALFQMILINFFLGTTRIKSLFLPSQREIMSLNYSSTRYIFNSLVNNHPCCNSFFSCYS